MPENEDREPVRVLLATEAKMREQSTVPGSPIEGRAEVTRVEWPEWLPDRVTPDRYRQLDARLPLSPDEDAYLERFDAALSTADALVVSPWSWACVPTFTEERWARAKRLKVIAGTFDHRFHGMFAVADALARGVTVIDTSRSMTPSVAEFALAMTLNLLRDIPAAVQAVREGGWRPATPGLSAFVNGNLADRRVGLAGYGSINRRYAELLRPFGCAAAAYDPFVTDNELVRAGIEPQRSLVDLAARSEILVVGIPPTPATHQVISAEVIDALPRGALVVLVTRMFVVDQAALWARAAAGEIRAAVDVFDPEPPPLDAPYRTDPAVLPTPHLAGDTLFGHRQCFAAACTDTLAVLAGDIPRSPVSVRDDLIYRGASSADLS